MEHEVYKRLNNLSMDELIKVMTILKENNHESIKNKEKKK